MATPRKPDAQRGRPRKDFLHDSDAPAIAIAMALQLIGTSEKNAYLIVSVIALGRKTAEREEQPRRKRGVAGGLPAGVLPAMNASGVAQAQRRQPFPDLPTRYARRRTGHNKTDRPRAGCARPAT